MVKVAIAGGTGDISRTILEVIKDYPQHQAVVFTRKITQKILDAPEIATNYEDVDGLRRTLEENQIHTVICALSTSNEIANKSQLNLIKASGASSETKRFVPSVFSVAYPEESKDDPTVKGYFDAINELKKTDLQWTLVLNGPFMDYFMAGRIKSYLRPYPMVIDIENKTAALPGDGNSPVTFTYSFDMARFLVASLDLEEWPVESRIAGDTVTWNDFVRLAEKATGTKFKIVYDDVEKLRSAQITELPFQLPVYADIPKQVFQAALATFELWSLNSNIMAIPPEVNVRFPQFKPLTVEEMLDKCWKRA